MKFFPGVSMLSHQLLRNHAGIMLIGDYGSLRLLSDVVSDVNERSPLIRDKEGPFLSLAYDARKAYEQQREIIQPPEHFEEIGARYGVAILWPVLLPQQRMLRESLAWIDHGKKYQAITYALEAVIEEALREDFGSREPAVTEAWQRLDPAHPGFFERLHTRGALFCSWTKSQRRQLLPSLLWSFHPLFGIGAGAYPFGSNKQVTPEDLAAWEGYEWPDPKL